MKGSHRMTQLLSVEGALGHRPRLEGASFDLPIAVGITAASCAFLSDLDPAPPFSWAMHPNRSCYLCAAQSSGRACRLAANGMTSAPA